jgi:hypothetical protein
MRLRGSRSRGPAVAAGLTIILLVIVAAVYILYFIPR